MNPVDEVYSIYSNSAGFVLFALGYFHTDGTNFLFYRLIIHTLRGSVHMEPS